MKTSEIRRTFLKFFAEKDHKITPGSSLIPAGDKTLLFTNAGMVQFKDVFLGRESREYKRTATVQRCLRAGGKHNDLENVGFTARHHTFFEMLGNFSFGDYFKREAINYAWEFLTQTLNLPPEKLWVTVYEDDDEASDIWLNQIGVAADRFSRCGAEDNFWSMGDIGPCGPCSEIFYDHGADIAGSPPGVGAEDEGGDRFVEIWNLVFMQYDRDENGKLSSLPHPSVDTGMGLERLAAVLQGVHDNYDIDIFQNLIKQTALILNVEDWNHTSVKVIADHIRACCFLVLDGVRPSNERQGYVLRRIIRRAVRHGVKLGCDDTFFYKLVAPLATEMGEAYPELAANSGKISAVLRREEDKFRETVTAGLKMLENEIFSLTGATINGEVVFRLYDTYGFPVDLTHDIARERGLTLDMEGFARHMELQRNRARQAGKFVSDGGKEFPATSGATQFVGYDTYESDCAVTAIIVNGKSVKFAEENTEAAIVTDKTPFYPESGGQVADSGFLGASALSGAKKHNKSILHFVKLAENVRAGDVLTARVNKNSRINTAVHHSATHLLHAALRRILGEHIEQKGSLVKGSGLRFDFSHHAPLSSGELKQIEQLVNEQIKNSLDVTTRIMDLEDAKKTQALALFDEKYDAKVRVLSMGDFSTELCGGTHVSNTADIRYFKIVSETGIASGVRRIEALGGESACEYLNSADEILASLEEKFNTARANIVDKLSAVLNKNRLQEKEIETLKRKLAGAAAADMTEQAENINGLNILVMEIKDSEPSALRDMADGFRAKLENAVVVLAVNNNGSLGYVAAVANRVSERIKAGEIIKRLAAFIGGKGGGRADFAQGGGGDGKKLKPALEKIREFLKEKVSDHLKAPVDGGQ